MARITGIGKSNSYQVDMCNGPLFGQIVRFVIPLIISGLLQFFFHSTDLIVIGRLSSHRALAAVGATGALTMLMINIFIGLSVGTNVLVARYLGEQNRKDISRTVHTAITISLGGGLFLAAVGICFSKPLLTLMGTPPDILDMSALYMKIIFAGMPVQMLYNFGSAILRAMGDTTRPFYFLLTGGIINILLNLFFVIVFKWDVAGVGVATVIAQGISALLVSRVLLKMRGPCRVKLQGLHIRWKNLREMMWIGVPAGFQASCFSLSNMLIQSSINKFGSLVIAAMTASGTLEMLAHIAFNAIGQAVVSFVGQNYGGKKADRIKKSIQICLTLGILCAITIAVILLLFGGVFIGIFNTDPEVIRYGIERFRITLPLLFLCAVMEIVTGALRGLGNSVGPTVISLFCICALRVVWLFTIFRVYPTLFVLLVGYPVTWLLNVIGVSLLLRHVLKKIMPGLKDQTASV